MSERTGQLHPGEHVLVELDFATTLRVRDDGGQQRAQLVCLNRGDPRERFSAPNTMLLNKSVYFGTDAVLYSSSCQPMMTITDSTAGGHDTLPGPAVHGRLDDAEARTALVGALTTIGLRAAQVPFAFGLFTHHELDESGTVRPPTGTASAGDHVDLRAELDLVVALVHAGTLDTGDRSSRGAESTITFEVRAAGANAGPQ